MKPYTVIYMDTKGPRVLGGFDDKGDCRRAWKHHRAGAAIVGGNDGAVLECKTGTSDSVKRQLEAYAAHLKRQGPAAEEPATAPAEEPAQEPVRAKVKVARVELEVEEEAEEPAEAPEAATTCTAKGCKAPTAGVRSDTNPVLRDFCRRDRKLANDHARSLDGGVAEAAKRLRAGTLTMTRQESGRRGGLAARRAKKAKAKPARKPVARRDLKPAKVMKPQRARGVPTLAAGLERVKRYAAVVDALGGVEQAEQLAVVVRDAGGVNVVVEAITELRSVA